VIEDIVADHAGTELQLSTLFRHLPAAVLKARFKGAAKRIAKTGSRLKA